MSDIAVEQLHHSFYRVGSPGAHNPSRWSGGQVATAVDIDLLTLLLGSCAAV